MTGIKWVGPVKLSEITQYVKSIISFRTSNSLQSFAISAVYEIPHFVLFRKWPYLFFVFLDLPYNSLLSSLEIGFRCMKLQNPPLVHSLKYKEHTDKSMY